MRTQIVLQNAYQIYKQCSSTTHHIEVLKIKLQIKKFKKHQNNDEGKQLQKCVRI